MATTANINVVTQDYANILYRTPTTAEANSWASLLDASVFTAAQVASSIANSVEATTVVDPLVRLYQAAFNRAPDKAGLTAWVAAVNAGTSISTVASLFTQSTEFSTLYGSATPSGSAYAAALYQNVLGRAPDAAGLAAWTAALNAGTVNAAGALLGFSNSAEFVSNSTATITSWLTTYATSNTYVQSVAIGGKAPNATTSTTTAGSTYTLTTGVDTITGTSGNDTFVADNTGSTAQTSIADTIIGNGGTDLLKIYSKGTAATLDALPTMNGISSLYINGGEYSGKTLDLTASSITGLSSFQFDSPVLSATSTITIKSTGVAVTISNMADAATAQQITLAGNTDTAVNLTLSTVTGTGNTFDFSGTKAATINITSNTAANSIANITDTGAAAATLNISGAKGLTATLNGGGWASTGIAAINASGMTVAAGTAGAVITVAAGTGATTGANLATNFAFTGSPGDDTLDLSAATIANSAMTAAQLNSMTFNGGLGNDTVILSTTIAAGTTAITSLPTSIEQIGVASIASAGVIDMTKFANQTGILFTGSEGGTFTVNNMPSTSTIDFGSSNLNANTAAGTFNAAGTGTSDTLTFKLGGVSGTPGTTTIVGFETVNLTSGVGANSLANLTLTASAGGNETLAITATKNFQVGALTLGGTSTAITITGSGTVSSTGAITAGSLTDTGTGALTVGSGSNILSINAAAVNAVVTINDSAAGSAASISAGNGGNSITAGSGSDVITVGSGANTISGGAGADRITVATHSGNADTFVLKTLATTDGGDSGTFTAAGTNAAGVSTSTFDIITGATKGDILSLANAAAGTSAYTAATASGAASGKIVTALVTSNDVSAPGLADNSVGFVRGTFNSGSNTFVGSSAGADTLAWFDTSATAASTNYEAVVLVGYAGTTATIASNGTNAATVTLG